MAPCGALEIFARKTVKPDKVSGEEAPSGIVPYDVRIGIASSCLVTRFFTKSLKYCEFNLFKMI